MKEYILLIPNNIKKEIINIVRQEYTEYNVKFMSLEDFIKNYVFNYNKKTIYMLMKKYNINEDIANIYINNLYYINNKINTKKMQKLIEIKKYLDENNLLIYNKHFKNYIKNKEIYVYGYNYIDKYQKTILEKLNYKEIKKENTKYSIKKIYEAKNIEDEVVFVANKISKLLKNDININNIKIIASSEYKEIIKRIFKLYNIPVNINKYSIFSTYESKKILNNLNNINEVLEEIKNLELKNKIINVLNNYSFIDNKQEVKELIETELKNTYITKDVQGIDLIDINDYISDDNCIFLMGYNKENIPVIHKDSDYFSDKEKEELNLDTSNIKNIIIRENIKNKLLSIKNLTVSYKLYDSNNNYTKSDLFENEDIEEITNNDYTNSNKFNEIELTKKLDNLIKYNIWEKDINLLYSNYKIPYMQYNNEYKQIEKEKIFKYINNNLTLSYTSFDNYNKCKFKFLLNNVLKLNIIKDDFAIIVGNICHYVLSNIDKENFNIDIYFDDYIKKQREFTPKEKFFLSNIKEELTFIIETIKKQLTYSTFDKKLYEEKIYVNLNRNIKITFMGIIDKLLYKEDAGKTYLVIIDYKTGPTDIKLENIEYGIGLQLPIYLYLSSKMKLKNIEIVGFYLQKLLNNNLDVTKDYITAKENTLKLEGYSIDNESVLSKFDTTYKDSKLIKSMKTTSNGFSSYSKVLNKEEIDNLIKETNNQINKAITDILEADFKINPKIINGENISCKYCEYKDICYKREKDKIYINKNEGEHNE